MASAEVCIVGVGFVGASLLECFSRIYKCVGYDIDTSRIEKLRNENKCPNIQYTSNLDDAKQCKLFSVAVPTPLNSDQTAADLSIVEGALKGLSMFIKKMNLQKSTLVVLESSVSIGTSRRLLSELHQSGVHCGFSPERIDPGRVSPKDYDIPKIVSGYDDESLEHVKQFYGRVYKSIVPVSSMETAEMCKLYENCFRMVNIAYVDEIADACLKHGIDVHEMIRASSSKPFGFMPFYPGLGVGGSCIPINPYYLKLNCDLPLLMHATKTMEQRPIEKAMYYLKKYNNPNRILVVGVAFKPGESVTIASPSLPLIRTFVERNARVHYYDPLVNLSSSSSCEKMPMENWTAEKLQCEYDLIVVCIRQTKIDYSILDKVKRIPIVDFATNEFVHGDE